MVKTSDSGIQFEMLRHTIEAALKAPAVVVVSSAKSDDGKSVTAFGVTASLAKAGHRAVLVDANTAHPEVNAPWPPASVRYETLCDSAFTDASTGVDVIPLSSGIMESSLSTRSALDALRARYDYVIIDTDTIPTSRVALMLAGAANGVVLTYRSGRMPSSDDELTIRALESCRAKILGVVTATAETIRTFASRARSAPQLTRSKRDSSGGSAVESVVSAVRGA